MAAQTIKKRARFFVAVEGESEQSFLVWLHVLAQKELHRRWRTARTLYPRAELIVATMPSFSCCSNYHQSVLQTQ
jgi:hypothetical protein